jgi:hypothetical protein
MNADSLGILVLGFARPVLLDAVLQSLARQDAIALTHVWIDGTADLMEIKVRPEACADVARRFPVAGLRTHRGHLGNNKILLDSLRDMIERYERLIVLEDDCFPTARAVAVFRDELERCADRDDIFSIYGHPFLVPAEGETISRFQGWGWATTRRKLLPRLEEAEALYRLPEHRFLEYTRAKLTPEIVRKLDVTPGRNVLQSFYSWDACLALQSALAGQVHRRTPERVVFNCGMGGETGHFADAARLRQPPFNMIRPEEVWAHF